jgi:DNA-sulfur modification-associated
MPTWGTHRTAFGAHARSVSSRTSQNRPSIAAQLPLVRRVEMPPHRPRQARNVGHLVLEGEFEQRAINYWLAVTDNIPQWKDIRDGHLKPAEARAEYVLGHAVAFWALGAAGKTLIDRYPDEVSWKSRLAHLGEIDWRKINPDWQGICMLGSDIITRRQTREATAKYIQWKLGVIDEKPGPVLDVPEGAASS